MLADPPTEAMRAMGRPPQLVEVVIDWKADPVEGKARRSRVDHGRLLLLAGHLHRGLTSAALLALWKDGTADDYRSERDRVGPGDALVVLPLR